MTVNVKKRYNGSLPQVLVWFTSVGTDDIPDDPDTIAAFVVPTVHLPFIRDEEVVFESADPSSPRVRCDPFACVSEATALSLGGEVTNASIAYDDINLADIAALVVAAIEEAAQAARNRVLTVDDETDTNALPYIPIITTSISGGNGAITPAAGDTEVPYEDVAGVATPDDLAVVLNPDALYKVKFGVAGTTVDGVEQAEADVTAGTNGWTIGTNDGSDLTYTFSDVVADHAIVCKFVLIA